MKKANKIILSIALVLILALPVFAGGCFLFDSEKIEIYTSFKTEYEIGEKLDLTNGKIEYTDANGKKTIVEITTDMITAFNSDTVGNRDLIVTYKGNTITVPYKINPPAFPITNAIYRYEQISDETDVSIVFYFESPNVIRIGQGKIGGYLASGTYTKTYANDEWTCSFSATITIQSSSDGVWTGTITNISETSITVTLIVDSQTQTYIATRVTD
ncbi:MAG: bacterial Ig-like domain-containing protein [Christensenellales bacterium]